MMTALPPAGCLTAVRFPVWRKARIGVGFHEVSARQSDFAFVAAAAQIALDDDGRCRRLARGRRRRHPGADAARCGRDALVGSRLDEAAVREAVDAALADNRAAGRPRLGRLSPARARSRSPCARSPMPTKAARGSACALSSTSTAEARGRGRAAHHLLDCLRDKLGSPARMPAASTACAAPARC